MRLKPGVSLERADDVLRATEMAFDNARGQQDVFRAYVEAVNNRYAPLAEAFAVPDLSTGLRSPAYWHILQLGGGGEASAWPVSAQGYSWAPVTAIRQEIETQRRAFEAARNGLETLKELAGRPGLPIVYDTNVLNHWQLPGQIKWTDVLKEAGEPERRARLVVPMRVVEELDHQKWGKGPLADRADTALRHLEGVLRDAPPGGAVELRLGVTLEVWNGSDDRDVDADLAILRCAALLNELAPKLGVRVLTADLSMQLRARQMDLQVLRPPAGLKRST